MERCIKERLLWHIPSLKAVNLNTNRKTGTIQASKWKRPRALLLHWIKLRYNWWSNSNKATLYPRKRTISSFSRFTKRICQQTTTQIYQSFYTSIGTT